MSIAYKDHGIPQLVLFSVVVAIIMAFFATGITPNGTRIVLLIILLVVVVPLYSEAKQNKLPFINAKTTVLLGVFVWVLFDGIMYRYAIGKFSNETVLNALLGIFLFMGMVYLGYSINFPDYLKRILSAADYGDNFNTNKLSLMLIACFLIGFLQIILWGGGIGNVISVLAVGGRWVEPWGRGRLGTMTDYMKTVFQLFLMAAIQLFWFYYRYVKKYSIFLLLAMFALLISFRSGSRLTLALVGAPMLVMIYFNAWMSRNKKVIAGLVILIYVALSVMQLQLTVRDLPRGTPLGPIILDSFLSIVRQNPASYQRDNQFEVLLQYFQLIPSTIPHSGEWLILRPFYHFIPRAIWANKPEGITRFFEAQTNTAGQGLTTYAGSIIGDFYICQGWLGIIMAGFLLGFLAKQFDSLIDMAKRSPAVLLIYSYGIVFLFCSIRSYQIIYEGWFVFAILFYALRGIGLKKTNSSVKDDERL